MGGRRWTGLKKASFSWVGKEVGNTAGGRRRVEGWRTGHCLQPLQQPAPSPGPPPPRPRPAPHPLQVACCLEVDEIGLPGLKRWVPEATVGLIVTHGEGHGLRQTAGRQFGPEVVHQAPGERRIEGQWHREAVLAARLPPESPRPLLLHNHLVHTGHGEGTAQWSQ